MTFEGSILFSESSLNVTTFPNNFVEIGYEPNIQYEALTMKIKCVEYE